MCLKFVHSNSSECDQWGYFGELKERSFLSQELPSWVQSRQSKVEKGWKPDTLPLGGLVLTGPSMESLVSLGREHQFHYLLVQIRHKCGRCQICSIHLALNCWDLRHCLRLMECKHWSTYENDGDPLKCSEFLRSNLKPKRLYCSVENSNPLSSLWSPSPAKKRLEHIHVLPQWVPGSADGAADESFPPSLPGLMSQHMRRPPLH